MAYINRGHILRRGGDCVLQALHGVVVRQHAVHGRAGDGLARKGAGGVAGQHCAVAQAVALGHYLQRAGEVAAHDRVGLKIARLVADKLLKALVLRLDLDNKLVQLGYLAALLEGGAVGAAAFKLPVFIQQAGDKGGVGAGLAKADICVLADADFLPRKQREAVCGCGHVGHKPDRADDAVLYAFCNAAVDGLRVADIVGADDELFHFRPAFPFGSAEQALR